MIKYRQFGQDLCVIKSFVSALHYVGFTEEAKEINEHYASTDNKTANIYKTMENVINIAKIYLPRSMEYKPLSATNFTYTELPRHNIFLGIIETSDGHVNHAVTLFQDWIFDSNEEKAIPLCAQGLNYCSNDGSDMLLRFKHFRNGYLVRCQKKLKKNKVVLAWKNKRSHAARQE